ncbi:unnamed protein product [Echinostoma caproni]|uniref:CRAL-TRIO domain-containing protein n=1 Tax=Echinostoma caproni TaxID=27848 RepID=A0A183B215_9TREM|nr:unnamed protein product [Echinostoma caproni]
MLLDRLQRVHFIHPMLTEFSFSNFLFHPQFSFIQVDTILTWFKVPEVIEKYFPGGICGHDKLGRPLFIAPVGCLDPKSFLKCITRTEFLQSRVYELEHIMKVVFPQASARAGRLIDQLSVIMDMQGLGLKHMSPSLLTIVSESVTVLESNYPEVLGTCFVVNAPPLFSRLYAFIKPLLSRETQEKVQVSICWNSDIRIFSMYSQKTSLVSFRGTFINSELTSNGNIRLWLTSPYIHDISHALSCIFKIRNGLIGCPVVERIVCVRSTCEVPGSVPN